MCSYMCVRYACVFLFVGWLVGLAWLGLVGWLISCVLCVCAWFRVLCLVDGLHVLAVCVYDVFVSVIARLFACLVGGMCSV